MVTGTSRPGTGEATSGSRTGPAPVRAAISRAMPRIDRWSPRSAMTSMSMTGSPSGTRSWTSTPSGCRRVQHHDPAVVVAELELAGRRQHPVGGHARGCRGHAASSPGMAPPTWACTTTSSTSKLRAPQTSSTSSSPWVTRTTCSLSASGWGSRCSTRAVITPRVPAPGLRTSSTSSPVRPMNSTSSSSSDGHVDELGEPGQRDLHEAALLAAMGGGGRAFRSG